METLFFLYIKTNFIYTKHVVKTRHCKSLLILQTHAVLHWSMRYFCVGSWFDIFVSKQIFPWDFAISVQHLLRKNRIWDPSHSSENVTFPIWHSRQLFWNGQQWASFLFVREKNRNLTIFFNKSWQKKSHDTRPLKYKLEKPQIFLLFKWSI